MKKLFIGMLSVAMAAGVVSASAAPLKLKSDRAPKNLPGSELLDLSLATSGENTLVDSRVYLKPAPADGFFHVVSPAEVMNRRAAA